jgi:hypothetical protein
VKILILLVRACNCFRTCYMRKARLVGEFNSPRIPASGHQCEPLSHPSLSDLIPHFLTFPHVLVLGSYSVRKWPPHCGEVAYFAGSRVEILCREVELARSPDSIPNPTRVLTALVPNSLC